MCDKVAFMKEIYRRELNVELAEGTSIRNALDRNLTAYIISRFICNAKNIFEFTHFRCFCGNRLRC